MFTFLFAKTQLFFFACTPPHKSFFGLPSWWKYLGGKNDALGNCVPNVNLIGHPSNLWLIGLAILDSLLRIAGFVAVISIMVAGIELIRSEGSPEKATNARQRLLNSLVGLAIAGGATASANQATINNVLNALFVIVGALAVLFIILAGLRMVVSGDNPTKVAEARRQILFAALGLILLALAGIIVNFVLKKLG
jgi:hypothetical protein